MVATQLLMDKKVENSVITVLLEDAPELVIIDEYEYAIPTGAYSPLSEKRNVHSDILYFLMLKQDDYALMFGKE
jgi:hypothetical protein